ncbi:uncharacterized protein [Elaeis guineensis]|uniref:uncharacterized protein n=1 Tax=Elaeis guineensis var. tenera TaxID=51953 RepID=UPI003C6D9B75
MDAEAARMLARGLRAHKRKGVATSGSTKRARVEESSLAAPAQAAPVVDIPSDAEATAPRTSSRSPPTGAPVSGVRPAEAPVVEREKRRKSVARRVSSRRTAADESLCSKEGPENPFNDRDLIRRLIDGCILPDVVERIDRADPEQWAWDSLESFLEIGHQLLANIEALNHARRDIVQVEERCRTEIARLQEKTVEVVALQEALERVKQAREEERQTLEESARKAEAEAANLAEQISVLVSEARVLTVEEFKTSAEMRDLNVQFGQEAFIKGFELCQEKVVRKFLKLDLSFLGEESEDEAGPSPATIAIAAPLPGTSSSPTPAPED